MVSLLSLAPSPIQEQNANLSLALRGPPPLRVSSSSNSSKLEPKKKRDSANDLPEVEHIDWSDCSSESNSSASVAEDSCTNGNTADRPTKRRSNEGDELLKGVSIPDCTALNEEDDEDLCACLQSWKPFVDRVGNYMMTERLPFEYFDVWVPSTDKEGDKDSEDDDTSSSDLVEGSLRLCHVGHGTNDASELSCIMTMYQMKRFGSCSEKYSFPPGVGLPGRVFRSKQAMWDNELQEAPFRDFPRREQAQRFGLKQGLAIPLKLEDNRNVIIAMYSTQKVERSDAMVQQAISALLKQAQESLKESGGNKPEITAATAEPELYHTAILPDETEVEMAQRLAQHYDNGEEGCYPLVCLLWKAPCNRTLDQNNKVQQLKGVFCKAKQEQGPAVPDSLAATLVSEWGKLVQA